MDESGELIMSIAEKLRNEGKLEGERKGKLEERKRFIRFIIKNLNK